MANSSVIGNTAFESGGGAYSAILVNCTVSGNTAMCSNNAFGGGGAYGGALTNCILNNNVASGPLGTGGGAYGGILYNCQLTNNFTPWLGGGVDGSTLVNCILASNSVAASTFIVSGALATPYGGGSFNGSLSNCTLTGNSGYVGGGAYYSTLYNCKLIGNQAVSTGGGADSSTLNNCGLAYNSSLAGGGASGGTLNNCTLAANSAGTYGGGVNSATMNNCIAYYNSAVIGPNYYASTLNFCCTTPAPGSGTNMSLEPLLADVFHVSAASPCRGAGSSGYVSGNDIDGESWGNPPSIGCDEYYFSTATGPLSVGIQADNTNAVPNCALNFLANIMGAASANYWDFGDGLLISNRLAASHVWSSFGTYTVVFHVFNNSNPGGVSATVTVQVVKQPVHYVAANNPSPIPPYASWATAATNIQDAINVATVSGALVLVTNGSYGFGGQVVYGALTNRVAVTLPLKLQSVNGPGVTRILGNPVLGDSAVRCVYLTNGSSLCGFTLTNGAARTAGDPDCEQSGGGVWCASSSVLVSNCVLVSNSALQDGCGAYCGTFNNCSLLFNVGNVGEFSISGEAAYFATLNNCLICTNQCLGVNDSTLNGCAVAGNASTGADNSSLTNCSIYGNGGGVSSSSIDHCVVTNNAGCGASASTVSHCLLANNTGGGATSSTLSQSALMGNSSGSGAGAENCVVNGCALIGNSSSYQAGGAENSTLTNCILMGNSAGGAGGGAYVCTLINCTIISNSAAYAPGGAESGILDNCIVYHNAVISAGQTSLNNVTNATLNNCCISPLPASGANNITLDPAFVSILTGNLRLQTNSPCINAGNNAYIAADKDLDGRPRIVGGAVDMGAYEFQGAGVGEFIGWLQQYGLATDGSADYADTDGDGMNNWQEWVAGTDPTSAASVLRLQPPAFTPSALQLQWNSDTSHSYFVQRANSLGSPRSFQTIGTNVPGQPGETIFQDTAPPGGSALYRVGTTSSSGNSPLLLQIPKFVPPSATITWSSVTNRSYFIQRATNLVPPATFTLLQSNLAGLPGTTRFTDSNAPAYGAAFYRVGVQQ